MKFVILRMLFFLLGKLFVRFKRLRDLEINKIRKRASLIRRLHFSKALKCKLFENYNYSTLFYTKQVWLLRMLKINSKFIQCAENQLVADGFLKRSLLKLNSLRLRVFA